VSVAQLELDRIRAIGFYLFGHWFFPEYLELNYRAQSLLTRLLVKQS
jgi:hypothetical protein